MGRLSHILYLEPDMRAKVDSSIRKHCYARLDVILDDLNAQGITGFSRSALHRYARKLQTDDGFLLDTSDASVVTIVERSTGQVVVLKTPVSASALLAHIQALHPAELVS